MKLVIIIIFILVINQILTLRSPVPSLLTNKEIKEVMQCFGDLNLEEGCVICRYITQKINKIIDLSTTCPDIVQMSFPYPRMRTWTPDNKVINKWTALYNEQKNLHSGNNNLKVGPGGVVLDKKKLVELSIFQKNIGDIEPIKALGQGTFNKDSLGYNEELLKYNHNKVIAQQPNIAVSDIINPNNIKLPIESIDVYPQEYLKELTNSNSILETNSPLNNKNVLNSKAKEFFNSEKIELIPNENPNNNISNQLLTSFVETSMKGDDSKEEQRTKYSSTNLFGKKMKKRSRFPDVQWECAKSQITKMTKYLCEEEISSSYQKYCKPIFEQINLMIESFLYHDNQLEICQNIHMCPVSIDTSS